MPQLGLACLLVLVLDADVRFDIGGVVLFRDRSRTPLPAGPLTVIEGARSALWQIHAEHDVMFICGARGERVRKPYIEEQVELCAVPVLKGGPGSCFAGLVVSMGKAPEAPKGPRVHGTSGSKPQHSVRDYGSGEVRNYPAAHVPY